MYAREMPKPYALSSPVIELKKKGSLEVCTGVVAALLPLDGAKRITTMIAMTNLGTSSRASFQS
jgi:hypothetical protein